MTNDEAADGFQIPPKRWGLPAAFLVDELLVKQLKFDRSSLNADTFSLGIISEFCCGTLLAIGNSSRVRSHERVFSHGLTFSFKGIYRCRLVPNISGVPVRVLSKISMLAAMHGYLGVVLKDLVSV
jgi:hypothetical protein